MHFALHTFAIMSSFLFAYDFLTSLNPTDRLARCGRLVTLQEAEILQHSTGRNLSSYVSFIGNGDTGRAFATSYYIHNTQQAEHLDFSPLAHGEDFRDPPAFSNVREGHSSQLPEGAATIAAYDELLEMGLTLQQQEYSQFLCNLL